MFKFHGVRVHTKIIIFLALFLPFIVHFNDSLIEADDKLIQSACHDADSPSACLQCLQSDPNALKANRIEIATIVLSCLSKHASNLASNMSALAIRAEDNKKLMKSICQSCRKGYHGAMSDLNEAKRQITNGNYDDGNVLLSKALQNDLDCHNRILEHKELEFPGSVVYEMNVYEQLSDAALRIIDRL